jgi:predicted transcriptional regulator of viral defense system
MKSELFRLHAREYVSDLAAAGRYHFVSSDACKALDVSAAATKLALNRLAKQKMVAQPARGFYVIVPPEYRTLACLPPDQFIPALMQKLDQPYYVGLLSAAQYHGAAHHPPQEFQVLLEKSHRPIHCGRVRVTFIVRKHLRSVPVQTFNTSRGTILVSIPEATAIDLIGYIHHVGGLDQAATILCELVEQIDPQKLVNVAQTAPITWVQRLGYLIELVGASKKVSLLRDYVEKKARQTVPLLPSVSHEHSPRDAEWKLFVNAKVDPDI